MTEPTDDQLALDYARALQRGRRAYDKADDCLRQLHDRHPPGHTFELADGRTIELVDNFADSNVAWKPCGVRRYDATISKPKPKKKGRWGGGSKKAKRSTKKRAAKKSRK